ncbi:MAG: DUF3793 family protein [Synergistaceae bacterium]|jgi:hypothetical protein|nr:DUF3793 family protein [Synergistaceae bacterium]
MPTLQRFMMFLRTQDAAKFIESMIVCFAAPVIGGLKCGALLNLSRGDSDMMTAWISVREEIGRRYGLEFAEISCSKTSVLLLIYRSCLLRDQLHNDETREFLAELGYEFEERGAVAPYIRRLVSRFEAGLPHEVGIFLGYPLEDVKGFMENGGRNSKLSGYWKVYGDEAAAQRKFKEYRRAETESAEILMSCQFE